MARSCCNKYTAFSFNFNSQSIGECTIFIRTSVPLVKITSISTFNDVLSCFFSLFVWQIIIYITKAAAFIILNYALVKTVEIMKIRIIIAISS